VSRTAGIKKDRLDSIESVPSFVPLLLLFGSLHQIGFLTDVPSISFEELGNLRTPQPVILNTASSPHLQLRATPDKESVKQH
jgi:hypothetical protein